MEYEMLLTDKEMLFKIVENPKLRFEHVRSGNLVYFRPEYEKGCLCEFVKITNIECNYLVGINLNWLEDKVWKLG